MGLGSDRHPSPDPSPDPNPDPNQWFNGACEKVLFPHMASLFPSLISDGSKLRAHTIAVLKYNATHPRTVRSGSRSG